MSPSVSPGLVLVICGLKGEAAFAAGPRIRVVVSGARPRLLEERLAAVDPAGIAAVVSFGIAGGLDPALAVGDLVIPDMVLTEAGGRFPTSPLLTARWRAASGAWDASTLVGVDRPILGTDDKARLRRLTGAVALDMESHIAAAWAAAHGPPFGCLRAVSDGALDALPPLVPRAVRPDGSTDVLAVLTGLARHPGQFASLIRTGRNANAAVATLGRVRGLLGELGGLLGLDL